jgi:hypothetical protein
LSNQMKSLGLVLIAALALTVVFASTASATKFTAASYPVKLSGSQTLAHKFTIGGGTVTCKTATQSGEATAASETVTISPTFGECTAFGFVGAKITGLSSTGCDVLMFSNGETDLVCNSGDIQIDAGTCTVTLTSANNQNLKSTTFLNNANGTVSASTNVTGIHGTVTSGFGCPIAGGTYNNATYTGETLVEGKNSKGVAVAIDVN